MSTIEFDPGYTKEPYLSLCKDYESSNYPKDDFRVEWGPIFHRGRLDDSAELLLIGQDPATHEDMARRILVGEAGHRVQGFMKKLGVTKKYVMINTFLYSVASQSGGESHKGQASIVDYRNKWFAAICAPGKIKGVVAFGGLAQDAWHRFTNVAAGAAFKALPFQHVLHPTWPESSTAANHGDLEAAIKHLLDNWNQAISALKPTFGSPSSAPYEDEFKPSELPEIPAFDLPAGLPAWMASADGWAKRVGTGQEKRRTLQIVVPEGVIP